MKIPNYGIGTVDCLAFYQWLKPEFVLRVTSGNNGSANNDPGGVVDESVLKQAAAYIATMDGTKAGEGGNHNATFTVACRLVHGFNFTPDQALPLFEEWNQTCSPPWTTAELQHKLADAKKKEDRDCKPRGYLIAASDEMAKHFMATAKAYNDTNLADSPSDFASFPIGLLPPPLSQFVKEASSAIACDPSFVALPLLSALGAAVGDSYSLLIKRSWIAKPIIWTAIIGESGTSKSPAFEAVLKYSRQQQAIYHEQFQKANQVHESQLDEYEYQLGKRKKQRDLPKPTEPTAPICRRTVVNDSTVEGLISVLKDNPSGVLLERDELAGWFGSHDKYNSGKSDAASYLSMFNAGPIRVDRKGPGYVHVPAAYVAITGGIQPGILKRCLSPEYRESGLAARFLMAWPPRIAKVWTEDDISEEIDNQMSRLFEWLFNLQPAIDEASKRSPNLLTLDHEAKEIWKHFYNQHNIEQNRTSGDVSAAFSKLEEYPLRFAIVFHLVECFMGTANGVEISRSTIQRGVDLTNWFKNESQRIYAELNKSAKKSAQDRLIDWIVSKGGSVTSRILQQSNRQYRPVAKAESALNELVVSGFGTWQSFANGNKEFLLSTCQRANMSTVGM